MCPICVPKHAVHDAASTFLQAALHDAPSDPGASVHHTPVQPTIEPEAFYNHGNPSAWSGMYLTIGLTTLFLFLIV